MSLRRPLAIAQALVSVTSTATPPPNGPLELFVGLSQDVFVAVKSELWRWGPGGDDDRQWGPGGDVDRKQVIYLVVFRGVSLAWFSFGALRHSRSCAALSAGG